MFARTTGSGSHPSIFRRSHPDKHRPDKDEDGTPVWFALKMGPSTFGIFDAFANEENRQAHLNGRIAQALMANAPELLREPPVIEQIDVLGAKL